ncbi:MAG TPA: STAS domain-containing protein [Ilumatobacteraceae bacterium]|nr:STAS domain-containing protein [Ilumatobacteraceae bacterium]
MNLESSVGLVGSVPVIALRGPIDLATLPTLRAQVMRALDRYPGQRVLLDLDEVPSLDDAGLGIILALGAAARQRQGELALVCSNDKLRNRLTAMRLDRALDVAASITAATNRSSSAER